MAVWKVDVEKEVKVAEIEVEGLEATLRGVGGDIIMQFPIDAQAAAQIKQILESQMPT